MKKHSHYGTVKDGGFVADNEDDLDITFQLLDTHRVEVNFKRVSKKRSNPQNKYYWGVVLPLISKQIGYTVDETHEVLKYRHLNTTVGTDIKMDMIKKTSDLTTKEFEDYLKDVRTWASDFLGMCIPLPNEKDLY